MTLLSPQRRARADRSVRVGGSRRIARPKAGGVALLTLAVLVSGVVLAQRRWGWRGNDGPPFRTAREYEWQSLGTPTWTNAPGFEHDVFTFVRLYYEYGRSRPGRGWGRGAGWTTDLPDSDLNLSYRLQQMTSMRVDPDGRTLRIADPDLVNYPFVYIVEPGGLSLDDEEVVALRKYLLNGGFLWLDDFWGEAEWSVCEDAIREVFPDRRFVELSLDHPIYHGVFEIKAKHQVPNIRLGVESQFHNVTWERPDAQEVHHRAIFDDQGRMMILATHNTDNGDGWEREGENEYYFEHFSEKTAYPLAINVLFYVMTH